MKLKIPVEVDLNGIDGIVDEIKCLQRYKLSEDDDMVLVSLDDVAEILMNHIEAKRKSEPQRIRGKWIPQGWNDTYCKCSCCDAVYVTAKIPYNFCPNCGAKMFDPQESEVKKDVSKTG